MSPEPVTRAVNLPLQRTSASPDPVTDTLVFVDFKSNPWKSPEPVTPAFKFSVDPFIVKSPDPEILPIAFLAWIFKIISPDPDNTASKLVERIISSFHKSPEPESDTASISSKGTFMVIVLFLLGVNCFPFSVLIKV